MARTPADPHRYEIIDESRSFEATDRDAFDRVAFTLRALRALSPRAMTVAVYSRRGPLQIESVRDLRRGERATWATIGVPPHASREQIAYALAELTGRERTPYAVECLIAAGRGASG